MRIVLIHHNAYNHTPVFQQKEHQKDMVIKQLVMQKDMQQDIPLRNYNSLQSSLEVPLCVVTSRELSNNNTVHLPICIVSHHFYVRINILKHNQYDTMLNNTLQKYPQNVLVFDNT